MRSTAVGSSIQRLGRIVFAGGVAGAVAGLVWGGIGGRIAMRILFLTSDSRVGGLQSDDDFTIGVISSSTMFLLMATTMIGGILGPVAGVLRSALHNSTRAAATGFAVASATFIGGLIVHADGIDFRLIDPLPLTVALFVLLPGAAAATGVILLDRLLRPRSFVARLPGWLTTAVALLGTIPIVVFTGAAVRNPVSLLVLAGVTLAALVVARITISAKDSGSQARLALHWGAWGVLIALTVIGTAELARDLAALT